MKCDTLWKKNLWIIGIDEGKLTRRPMRQNRRRKQSTHNVSNLTLDKNAKTSCWRKKASSANGAGKHGCPHAEEWTRSGVSHFAQNLTPNESKTQRESCNTDSARGKHGQCPLDTAAGKDFLKKTDWQACAQLKKQSTWWRGSTQNRRESLPATYLTKN